MIRLLCSILLFWAGGAKAQDVLNFGTYVGRVHNVALDQDQLVKLELVASRQDGNAIRLRSILTLQFGGFDSGEYSSYHFHDVNFNLITGVLSFNQTDQEAYLVNASIRNNILTADLYSASGLVGPVRLQASRGAATSNRPLIEPLGGEYRGRCGQTPATLQLYTFRNTEDTYRPGNQFSAYAVRGQLGKHDPLYCSPLKSDYCVYSKIVSASYNFHRGALVLNGSPFSLTCRVRGSSIDCGECAFKRASDEMKAPLPMPIRPPLNPIEALQQRLVRDKSATLAGEYKGYIYHENLNVFQPVTVEVSTFQKFKDGVASLYLAANTRISFGSFADESISYRYDPLPFPSPLLIPRFVLARPEADVDAMVLVTSIKDGVVEGVWYSLLFGRVGSFVATQNGDMVSLPASKILGSLSGLYAEVERPADVRVHMIASQRGAPVGSDNPFYPLTIMGNIWRESGIVRKESIVSGSYDFYTGRVGITFGDNQALAGWIKSGQASRFRRMAGGFGTLMQSFDLNRFSVQQTENAVEAL